MELPIEVKQEVDKIFEHATVEELSRLQTGLPLLDGSNVFHCVYGLLTGDCFGARTTELVKLCSPQTPINDGGAKRDYTDLEIFIDGSPYGERKAKQHELLKEFVYGKFK